MSSHEGRLHVGVCVRVRVRVCVCVRARARSTKHDEKPPTQNNPGKSSKKVGQADLSASYQPRIATRL